MRPQIRRKEKYDAKLSGDVAKNRTDAHGPAQVGSFMTVVGDQVGIERLTKQVLTENGVMPGLNHFYMNFAKKIAKDKAMYSGNTLVTEVCAERDHWELRGLSGTVLDVIISRLGLPTCAPPVIICDWLYKRKLTFSGNVSTTNLDSFPVLVHLTNANFDFNKAQNNGEDIRFVDSDTCPAPGNILDYEIELWDKPGANAWVWVKVPRIDGNSVTDFIYMFYGNNAAADAQNPTGVWSNNYTGVWHLRSTTIAVPDSTSYGYDGTKTAAGQPLGGSQKIDGGQDFSVANCLISCGDHSEHDGGSSISATGWIYLDSDTDAALINKYDRAQGTSGLGWGLWYNAGANAFVAVCTTVAGGNTLYAAWSPASVWTGAWHHIVLTYDGDILRLYVDGAPSGTDNTMTGDMTDVIVNLTIGARTRAPFDMYLDGKADECRVNKNVLTADWIMAQWKSQDETMITYGAEEPA